MGPADTSRDGSIHRILRISRQAIRLMDLSAALLVLVSFALAGLLAMIAADSLTDGGLSAGWRLGLRTAWLIGLVALAGWLIGWPLGRRISDLYAARSLEKSNPAVGNDLTAAVQLADRDDLDESTRRVLHDQAVLAARQASPAPAESATLKRASIVLGVVLGLSVIYLLATPRPVGASLARVLLGKDQALPLPSGLTLLSPPDNQGVIVGQPVAFTAELDRPGPEPHLELFDQPAGSPRRLPMTAGPLPGQFTARWTPALAGAELQWRVVRENEQTSRRILRVLPRPAIRSVRAEVAWPAYTGRGMQPSTGGTIRAPAGAFVTIFAEANLPVARATLSFETGNRSIIMPLDGDATHLRTTFRIRRSDRYCIRFAAQGLDEPGESVWYEIIALADTPPTVTLDEPAGDLDWPINRPLPLTGRASDEFGLASMRCVIRHGETTRAIPLGRFASPGQTASPFQHTLDLAAMAQPGDTLAVQVEARDHKPGPPSEPVGQLGTSRAFTVRLLPPDAAIEAQNQAELQARQRSQTEPRTQPAPGDQPADAVADTFQAGPADAETLRALRRAVESTQPASPPSSAPARPAAATPTDAQTSGDGSPAPQSQTQPAPPSASPAPADHPSSSQPASQPASAPTPAQPGDASQTPPAQPQPQPNPAESTPAQSQPSPQSPPDAPSTPTDPSADASQSDQPAGEQNEAGTQAQPAQGQGDAGEQSQPGDGQGQGGTETQSGQGETGGQQGQGGESQGDSGSEAQPGDGQGQGGAETQSGQGETEGQEGQGGESQGGSGNEAQPGGNGQSQGEPGGQEGLSGSTSAGAGAGESSSGQGRQERQELLAIAEALEEVARQLDAGQVDPRLLEQLDMTGPELRVFVKKYAPLAQQLSPAPAGETQSPRRIETIAQTGDASTQAGQGSVTASRQGPAGSARDPNARQQHDVRVGPKHRPRLEGYLRAVSQDKP